MDRCKRQDPNSMNAGDEFEIPCPSCGQSIEFFKDDKKRKCPKCGEIVTPKSDG